MSIALFLLQIACVALTTAGVKLCWLVNVLLVCVEQEQG
jgi:hypothetical protein